MFIESTGMVCSVGLSAEAACAAMRAGIANFQELPYLDNQREPIIGAMVPGLAPHLKRGERLRELLAMAVADCLQDKITEPMECIPLLIGLAEPERPDGGLGTADDIVVQMFEKVGVRFHAQLSRTIAKGHTSGFEGLRIAKELLRDSAIDACIVCGVDSYVNATSLLWLEQNQRLKTVENSDGVIPGEAAAAALITKIANHDQSLLAQVMGLGFAAEKANVLNEEPLLGLGLAGAARTALGETGLQLHEIDFRLSDVTGESYGFKEQALLLARVMRGRRAEFPIWHCSESIGDTGAAVGVCHLVRAFEAFEKGYAPGDRCVGFASNVTGERAAVILQRHGNVSVSRTDREDSTRGRA